MVPLRGEAGLHRGLLQSRGRTQVSRWKAWLVISSLLPGSLREGSRWLSEKMEKVAELRVRARVYSLTLDPEDGRTDRMKGHMAARWLSGGGCPALPPHAEKASENSR